MSDEPLEPSCDETDENDTSLGSGTELPAQGDHVDDPQPDDGSNDTFEDQAVPDEDQDENEPDEEDWVGDAKPPRPASTWQVNQRTPGHLVLHFATRSVPIPMDGLSALRVLEIYGKRGTADWGDTLDPHRSSALAGWLVLDQANVLAMEWQPLPETSQRITIDPLPMAS